MSHRLQQSLQVTARQAGQVGSLQGTPFLPASSPPKSLWGGPLTAMATVAVGDKGHLDEQLLEITLWTDN